MRRRWAQFASTAIVLLLALVVLLLNNQRGTGDQPTATPSPASAAAAATATVQSIPPQTSAATTANVTQRSTTTRTTAPSRAAATIPPTPQAARSPTPTLDGKLPTIPFAQLPNEARETIQLIDQGGPFPYDRDGITFGNRERLLPIQPGGYYREYTVITPGSSDRGARRIVAGQRGELYYTDDHYESFKRVIR
jgi:ribonuclease T1